MSTGEERTRLENRDAPAGKLRLVVAGEGLSTTLDLPAEGRLTVGRSREAEVRIDLPGVSRRHAILHIGARLAIEDLGSSNGTRVREAKIEPGKPVEIAPGDVVELGSTVIVVQWRSPAATRAFRLFGRAYLESRIEEEIARATGTGARFAVLGVQIDGGPRAAAESALASALRPGDVAATEAGNLEALLPGATPEVAEAIAEALREGLRAASVRATVRLACHPRDARDPDALLGRARGTASPDESLPEGILETDSLRSLHRLVERVAASTIAVLLQGETGVGKEVFAERIHRLSPRAKGPLVKLNCAAFAESLLESELFGHERGSFTGAVAAKLGILETAKGGTVFLDEIGDLPLPMQAKLLRVLEEGAVRRVGGIESRPLDVRFVAATNRDLEVEAMRGTFRKDLYFRLAGVTLVVPPLRERVAEIEPLARAFAKETAARLGRPVPDIGPEAMDLLRRYGWPGNVRELRNVIERVVVLVPEGPVRPEHLPQGRLEATRAVEVASLRSGVAAAERDLIVEALAKTKGNQTKAARLLGVSRRLLVKRIAAYGLPQPRKAKKR